MNKRGGETKRETEEQREGFPVENHLDLAMVVEASGGGKLRRRAGEAVRR